jgi:hypothetical protein
VADRAAAVTTEDSSYCNTRAGFRERVYRNSQHVRTGVSTWDSDLEFFGWSLYLEILVGYDDVRAEHAAGRLLAVPAVAQDLDGVEGECSSIVGIPYLVFVVATIRDDNSGFTTEALTLNIIRHGIEET